MSKAGKRIVNPDTGEVLDPKTSPNFYTLDAIRNAEIWTPENIRQEYTRLYKIVSERMRTIAKSEIGRESKTYHYNKDKFKPVSQLKPYEQKLLLSEAAKMVQAKTGTIGGIKEYRKKAIQAFQRHGYTFVTEETFSDFGRFMQIWKDSRFRGYGSEVATNVYERLQDATAFERAATGTDRTSQLFAEFKKWQADESKFQRKSGKELTSAQLLEILDEFLE